MKTKIFNYKPYKRVKRRINSNRTAWTFHIKCRNRKLNQIHFITSYYGVNVPKRLDKIHLCGLPFEFTEL